MFGILRAYIHKKRVAMNKKHLFPILLISALVSVLVVLTAATFSGKLAQAKDNLEQISANEIWLIDENGFPRIVLTSKDNDTKEAGIYFHHPGSKKFRTGLYTKDQDAYLRIHNADGKQQFNVQTLKAKDTIRMQIAGTTYQDPSIKILDNKKNIVALGIEGQEIPYLALLDNDEVVFTMPYKLRP